MLPLTIVCMTLFGEIEIYLWHVMCIFAVQLSLLRAIWKVMMTRVPFLSEVTCVGYINSSHPEQNGCHFTDDIFKCIFIIDKICISIRILLKFVLWGLGDNKTTLGQVMVCDLFDPVYRHITKVSCQKGPFWQDTIELLRGWVEERFFIFRSGSVICNNPHHKLRWLKVKTSTNSATNTWVQF